MNDAPAGPSGGELGDATSTTAALALGEPVAAASSIAWPGRARRAGGRRRRHVDHRGHVPRGSDRVAGYRTICGGSRIRR